MDAAGYNFGFDHALQLVHEAGAAILAVRDRNENLHTIIKEGIILPKAYLLLRWQIFEPMKLSCKA